MPKKATSDFEQAARRATRILVPVQFTPAFGAYVDLPLEQALFLAQAAKTKGVEVPYRLYADEGVLFVGL